MKDIIKILNEHLKREGRKLVDIRGELLDFALSLYSLDSEWGKDYDLHDQRHKDLSGLHHKIMQEIIDFIKENPGIREMIESKRKEISDKTNYIPDLRIYFEASGLENSIDFGEWTPATDSSLGIYLGSVNVIASE